MNSNIAIIIPYFGQWPEWIDLYLYSCSKNPQIDFLFYTDCPVPSHVYANTLFTKISFSSYCDKVSKKLGINFCPTKAYKLCDLKVFYGLVHADSIQNYDYWGFADIDLVLGNLSILTNETNLRKYDIITSHSYHIGGHFTIIKKKSKFTSLCLKIPNWQSLLTSNDNLALDENCWSNLVYPELKQIRRIYKYIVQPLFKINFFKYLEFSNRLFCNRFSRRSFNEYFTTPNPKVSEIWKYNPTEGRIWRYDGLELPYLHFLFFKKTIYKETEEYWRNGFYKLQKDWLANENTTIIITLNGIEEEQENQTSSNQLK